MGDRFNNFLESLILIVILLAIYWVLGFLILNEAITPKVIISLLAVIIGIYIVKKGSKIKLV